MDFADIEDDIKAEMIVWNWEGGTRNTSEIRVNLAQLLFCYNWLCIDVWKIATTSPIPSPSLKQIVNSSDALVTIYWAVLS